jgi:hypothetical protein
MFAFSIRFWEVGVGIFQHFVLIAVTQLAGEGAVLGASFAVGVGRLVFYRTFAHSFVCASLWASLCRVVHCALLDLVSKSF